MLSPKLSFADKLLPVQPEQSELFDGDQAHVHERLYQMILDASGIRSPLEEFELTLSEKFTLPQMASSPVQLRFLQLLIRMIGAHRVLEIGAFVGVSTMAMAKALPPGGKVTSIEKFDHFADICRINFKKNGLADRIEMLQGDAMEVVSQLPKDQVFDFIFIDGNKECYREYFDRLEPRLTARGLMVVDDVLFHCDALNETPRTPKGKGTLDFLKRAAEASGYLRLLLPIGNGMMLMFKS
jgi:predicted O-methyltransferase YrrM